MSPRLGADEVRAAREVIADRIHRTPCLSFSSAARHVGGDALFLKCENLQKVGAFKARGALHHLRRLCERGRPRGVTTYSSGNHAAATAWAAAQLELPARVFVPEDAPASKVAATRSYGAEVEFAGTTSAHRKAACEAAATAEGLHVVPPFDDPWIVAGQGTVGLEILEQCPAVRRVLCPIGGGGLFSGVASAIRSQREDVELIGVEPVAAASMSAAVEAGGPVPIEVGPTIADGLRPTQVGELCHELVVAWGARVLTIQDEWILDAMRWLFERAHLGVEPSGAATLAAYLHHPEVARDGSTVVVLSGGNVDLARLAQLLPTPV